MKFEISLAHAEFLQSCIYAKQYGFAESQVQDTWPKPRKDIDSDSHLVLRYFYLRGIVHMGTCNWAWATRCFSTCVCIPLESSSTVSAIAVAAWKKLALVACLQHDFHTKDLSLPLHPKHMTSKLKTYIDDATRSLLPTNEACPESTSVAIIEDPMPRRDNPSSETPMSHKYGVALYKELVSAFEKGDRQAFDSVMKQASSLFDQDGTTGLVQRVDAVLLRRQVYRIGSMFATISLHELKTQLLIAGDPQALLRELSEEMAWPVRVEDGWVYFPSDIPAAQPASVVAQTQHDMAVLRTHLTKLHSESVPKVPRNKDDVKDQNRREAHIMGNV